MEQHIVKISREFHFTAIHQIFDRFGLGKHEEPHTHNYRLIVTIEGPLPESGMLMDFSDLKKIVQEQVIDKLEGRNLNDDFLQPSAEIIAIKIWEKIESSFPAHVTLKKIKLYENESSSVTYKGMKKDVPHTCGCHSLK